MRDPQIMNTEDGEADAHAEDHGAAHAPNAPARDVHRGIPVLRLVETARAPQAADPFDDLQPMLDLRFPEPDTESIALDERTVAPTPGGDPDIIALSDATAAPTWGTPANELSMPDDPSPAVLAEVVEEATPAEAGEDRVEALDSVELVAQEPDPAVEPEQNEPAMPEDDPQASADDLRSAEWNAAQQIASEADATAQALENLKHLIAHRMPDIDVDAPAPPSDEDRVRPPPIQAFAAPPPAVVAIDAEQDALEPIELAALVGEDHHIRRNPAWQGFLAGFMASWAIGAALYAYLVFA